MSLAKSMGINGINRKINAKLSTVVLLAMASMLPACDQLEQGQRILSGVEKVLENPGTTTLTWDEEVKLHDGRVILIKPRDA